MIPLSALFVRRRYYKLFIDSHIILAILGLATCYHHIFFMYGHAWGYDNWIYLALLLWVIERAIRAIKIARNDFKTARVTLINDEYIRLDILEIKGTGHTYLYFPTLSWRFWENHPFSIASSVYELFDADMNGEKTLQDSPEFVLVGSDSDSDTESDMEEGHKLSDLLKNKHDKGDETTLDVPETPLLRRLLIPRWVYYQTLLRPMLGKDSHSNEATTTQFQKPLILA
jgi:hypothetical protein